MSLTVSPKRKEIIAISLIVVSCGTLSLRAENGALFITSSILLLVLSFITRKPTPVIGLALLGVMLYPIPISGWIYGRDANHGIYVTQKILSEGWPISLPFRRTFTGTPFRSFHTGIVSSVTNLGISPSTTGRPLIPAILPMVYTSGALLFTYLIGRRLAPSFDVAAGMTVLPVILWTPLFALKSAYRRQSIGFFLFALACGIVFYYLLSNRSRRWSFMLLIVSFAMIAAHHLTAIIFFIFLFSISTGEDIFNNTSNITEYSGIKTIAVIFSALFILWQLFGEFGALLTIAVFANYLSGLSIETLRTLFDSGGSSTAFPYEISEPIVRRIIPFGGRWLFAIIIGIGFGILGLHIYTDRQNYETSTVLWASGIGVFGILAGILSAFSWIAGTISFQRILTFGIVAAAPLSILGYSRLANNTVFSKNAGKLDHSRVFITVIPVVLLTLIGFQLIPGHVVFTDDPIHKYGESSERFPPQQYATAEFISDYDTSASILADPNVAGAIVREAELEVETRPMVFISGDIPKNVTAVVTKRNEDLYFAFIVAGRNGGVRINPPNVPDVFNQKNSKIYSNQMMNVYKNNISDDD